MFQRAIVLGDDEFRSLVLDFIEMARDEFEGKGDLRVEEFEDKVYFPEFFELFEPFVVEFVPDYCGGLG